MDADGFKYAGDFAEWNVEVVREALVAAGIDWELADHLGSFVAETSIRHGSNCSEIGIHISTALSEDLGEQYDWWTPQGVLEQLESANRQSTFLYGESGVTSAVLVAYSGKTLKRHRESIGNQTARRIVEVT